MTRPALAFAVLCLACSSYKAPLPPAPREATTVGASAGRTWDAVIDLFAARNIPISTIERASGFVAAEELSVGDEGLGWADCGKLNGRRLGPNRGIYNVLVRGDSTSASVKATVRWVHLTSKVQTLECSTTHHWEEGFESDVRLRAEGLRASGASASPIAPAAAQGTDGTASSAPEQPTSTSAPAPSPAAPTPAVPRAAPPPDASNMRPNNLLLSFEGFRRAIGDMQRKGLLLGYRESALERLEVDLTATAFGEPTLEYQLTRLFLAYGGTMNDDTQPTLVVQANGQQVGLYTRSGLRWDAASGRR